MCLDPWLLEKLFSESSSISGKAPNASALYGLAELNAGDASNRR